MKKIVLAAVSAVLMFSAFPATATPYATSTRFPQRWSPVFMAPQDVTKSQAVAVAKNFDVVISNGYTFKQYVGAMRTANPRLTLLAYVNGTFSMKDEGLRFDDSWYAHDSAGNTITSVYGNVLMDASKPRWASNVAWRCNSWITNYHYNGCLLDTLGTTIFDSGYVSALPVNPATNSEWTPGDWLAATVEIARVVKANVGTHIVVPNGIATGSKYFDASAPTKNLLGPTKTGMVELFVRAPFTSPTYYRAEALWKKDVEMLIDAGAGGSVLLTTTKTWTTITDAQKRQWHKFALATFLLGTNGHSYFSFVGSQDWAGVTANSSWDTVAIGSPTDSYVKFNGLYKRTFTNGFVLVNPTTTTVTLSLGGTYTTLDGVDVTKVTLKAETGEVLLKSS